MAQLLDLFGELGYDVFALVPQLKQVSNVADHRQHLLSRPRWPTPAFSLLHDVLRRFELFQKSGAEICSSIFSNCCVFEDVKIAPHSFRLLAELVIRPLEFFEGHKTPVYQAGRATPVGGLPAGARQECGARRPRRRTGLQNRRLEFLLSEARLGMIGLVSGHGLSRAVPLRKESGFSPCEMARPSRNAQPEHARSPRARSSPPPGQQGRALLQSERNATLMIDVLRSYVAAKKFGCTTLSSCRIICICS